MDHNYVRNDRFNVLTVTHAKGIFTLTGESSDPVEVGDTINYLGCEKDYVLGVDKLIERRDLKDFPKGNGLFYKVECTPKKKV